MTERKVSNFKKMAGHCNKTATPYHQSLGAAQNGFMLSHPEVRSLRSKKIVPRLEARIHHFTFRNA